MTASSRFAAGCRLSLTALCVSLLGAGCGGGPALAPVKGTVTYKGEPAKGGQLVFNPVSGGEGSKAATGVIQPDGTYALQTNSPGDGAVLGKHRITFTPPPQELTEEQRKNPKYTAPPPLYMGCRPKPDEVEIKSGQNTVDIELVK